MSGYTQSDAAVVVGAPSPARVTAVLGEVGQLAVTWTAPEINAELDVSYTVTVTDVTPGRDPATPDVTLPLTGPPGSTQTLPALVAGTKRVYITAYNVNAGPGLFAVGVESALHDAREAAFSTAPALLDATGDTTGATLAVFSPASASTPTINKFLIQVGRGHLGGHWGWLGPPLAWQLACPVPPPAPAT